MRAPQAAARKIYGTPHLFILVLLLGQSREGRFSPLFEVGQRKQIEANRTNILHAIALVLLPFHRHQDSLCHLPKLPRHRISTDC